MTYNVNQSPGENNYSGKGEELSALLYQVELNHTCQTETKGDNLLRNFREGNLEDSNTETNQNLVVEIINIFSSFDAIDINKLSIEELEQHRTELCLLRQIIEKTITTTCQNGFNRAIYLANINQLLTRISRITIVYETTAIGSIDNTKKLS
jgi:hypothetical protein